MSAARPAALDGGRGRVLRIAAALLALFCAIGIWRILATMGARVPFDPNEGWNAYLSAAAMAGGPLYPDPRSFLFDNYPPLSFYIVGALGALVGDNIVAGRMVSLLATLGAAAGIFTTLRRMQAGLAEASFAALLFVGGLLVFTDYVGMDDPQLLAHALALAGLAILVKRPHAPRSLAGAALLMTLAGFVKHNLIALPIAAAAWLAIQDRRDAARFAGLGIAFALTGLVLFRLTYGTGLLAMLNSPRLYSLRDAAGGVANWLPWGGIPALGLGALCVLRGRDKYVVLCAIYALVAIAAGAVFSGGAGVDMNVWFDAAIALAMGAGLMLDRLAGKTWLTAATAFVLVLPLGVGLGIAADGDWLTSGFWLHPQAEEEAMAGADISFLKSHDGPALCEMLSLCYWAGKRAQVDTFNLGQAFATRARGDDALVHLVERKYFRSAQFDSMSDFALGQRLRRAFEANYRVDHTDDEGVFLLPR